MLVHLIVLGGVHRGRRIPIAGPEFRIGRDPMCHLRPTSKEVQWEHCVIIIRDGSVFLRDQSGSAGVYLNRRLLMSGEMQLQDGDLMEVGPLSFKIAVSASEERDAGDELGADARALTRHDTRTGLQSGAVDMPISPAVRRAEPAIKPMKDCREMLCPM